MLKLIRLSMLVMAMTIPFSGPSLAMEDEAVRMRTDGGVIDADGKIIALPNRADSRNSGDKTYYSYVGDNGLAGTNSDFYVIYDENGGYRKRELDSDQPATVAPAIAAPAVGAPQQAINPGSTSIQMQNNPNKPFYDNLRNSGSVYGN